MIEQSEDNPIIGGYGRVNASIVNKLMEAIREQENFQKYNNGATATFWHVIAVLNNHLEQDRTLESIDE